jgi:hypothetical protein
MSLMATSLKLNDTSDVSRHDFDFWSSCRFSGMVFYVPTVLETADDGANEATLDAIRLDSLGDCQLGFLALAKCPVSTYDEAVWTVSLSLSGGLSFPYVCSVVILAFGRE